MRFAGQCPIIVPVPRGGPLPPLRQTVDSAVPRRRALNPPSKPPAPSHARCGRKWPIWRQFQNKFARAPPRAKEARSAVVARLAQSLAMRESPSRAARALDRRPEACCPRQLVLQSSDCSLFPLITINAATVRMLGPRPGRGGTFPAPRPPPLSLRSAPPPSRPRPRPRGPGRETQAGRRRGGDCGELIAAVSHCNDVSCGVGVPVVACRWRATLAEARSAHRTYVLSRTRFCLWKHPHI